MTARELQIHLSMYDPDSEIVLEADEHGVYLLVEDGRDTYEITSTAESTGH